MAHFAQINENSIVTQVLVIPDYEEQRGNDYLSKDLKLGGTWIQCSYNNSIRKQFPGIGFTYDPVNDIFIAPKPFNSWVLNENHDWIPPIDYPNDGNTYIWKEDIENWEQI
jgi:hypothetical protein